MQYHTQSLTLNSIFPDSTATTRALASFSLIELDKLENHMSVDLFKAEAKRLADHLAETHGIKLKHTSILAAIASLHGARDWNTLIGQQKPGLLKRAAAALAGTGTPVHSVAVGLEDLLYDLPNGALRFGLQHYPSGTTRVPGEMSDGQPVDIDDRSLTRHTLVVGPTGYGWSTFLESLAVQQVMRGGGMLVLDPRADLHMPRLVQQASRYAGRDDNFTVMLDDAQAPADMAVAAYDLFAGTDVAVMAQRLRAALLPPGENSPGADYYRMRLHELLEATLAAMKAVGEPLQLSALAGYLLQPERLFSLQARVQSMSIVASQLEQVLRPFIKQSKNGSEIDNKAYREAAGGTLGRLAQMARSPHAAAQPTRVLDLSHVFRQNQVGYVTGCARQSSNGVVRALIDDMLRVFEARKSELARQPKGKEPPFLLVVPCLTAVLPADAIRRLLSSAVEAHVAVVAHVTNLTQLDEEGATLADDVLTNTRLKVVFKQMAPRAFEQAVACLDHAAGLFSPEDRAATCARLMRLGVGEAVLFDGSGLRDLRIRMVHQPG